MEEVYTIIRALQEQTLYLQLSLLAHLMIMLVVIIVAVGK